MFSLRPMWTTQSVNLFWVFFFWVSDLPVPGFDPRSGKNLTFTTLSLVRDIGVKYRQLTHSATFFTGHPGACGKFSRETQRAYPVQSEDKIHVWCQYDIAMSHTSPASCNEQSINFRLFSCLVHQWYLIILGSPVVHQYNIRVGRF